MGYPVDSNGVPITAPQQSNVLIQDQDEMLKVLYLQSTNVRAKFSTSSTGPFAIGNSTLTILINGIQQAPAFPSRAAIAGFSFSAEGASQMPGGDKKIKVGIDGGVVSEVVITANLTSGDDIAASLQEKIRATVANGANVIVDWNVTNANRYTVTSGTTGPNSAVVLTKGGDGLAGRLKLGLQYGGQESTGLAANTYRAREVVDLLASGLSNVTVDIDAAGKVQVTTVLGGASATLQAVAGGANTALGFSTTLVTGSTGNGSNELRVNGSVTPVRFSLPDVDAGCVLLIEELLFLIRDDSGTPKRFGGINQLTNGILVQYQDSRFTTLETLFVAVTNAELGAFCHDSELLIDAYTDSDELFSGLYRFSVPVRIRPGTVDGVFVTVRDDLTGLNSFRILARGRLRRIG